MSDERDETRRYSPFDDATQADGGPARGDGPAASGPPTAPLPGVAGPGAVGPAGGGPLDDRTRTMPATPGDPTVVAPIPGGAPGRPPRPDATSVMPPVTDDWAASRGNAAWSGRAEVRAPRPGVTEYEETEWPAGPVREPRDKWWMPILIGVIVLVLLGALGWGIYLIVQKSGNDETPAPATTPSAAPLTTATTATTEPTTEPTTTSPPTTTPTTTEPTNEAITIPAMKGRSLAEARAALNSIGLNYRLIYRADGDATPGTVLDSDPPEGQEVPADTTVTLVIATAPQTTNPATPSPTTTDGPDDD
jgi:hypothetical protein